MTLAGNGSSRARARTGWNARGALIASQMLNLLLLGAFAGSDWATRPEQDSGKGRLGLLEYIERLPPDRRDAIRSFIDSERPSLRPLRVEVQQARAHAASILDADPLD